MPMKGYVENIEKLTLGNDNFREVLFTSLHSQLVVMSLEPEQEIGLETHPDNDQFIRCESGEGTCIIDEHEYSIEDGSAMVIPAWAEHNIINTSSSKQLKLYTLYSPPHHKDGTVHKTKEEADASDEEFGGRTSNL